MEKKPFSELGLSPEILKAIEALGFDQPSPIQAQAIPPGLEGRDVVGQSQTGSGKTMAFAIPAVQMLDPKVRAVGVLIMCPTRELAMQVCEAVHKLTQHKPGIKAIPVYGGATYERQIRGLRDGAQIVVGTPGRILDFIERGVLRLDKLKMLVFDEADEMLDMGFREDIEKLMEAVPAERQTLFFSATIDRPIRDLIERYTKDPAIITVEHKALTVPTVEQRFYDCHSRSKIEVLCRLLDTENPKLAIVFANTKRAVDDATDAMNARGYSADRLHGDLSQMMRDRVMKNFRSGAVEVLVATDVAARGLDVEEVDLVINYDLPYDEEDYVHRIGRTGRAGRAGKAISLVTGREIFLLQRIQRYAKVRIERHPIPTREDVDGRRIDAHLEKLRSMLETGSFKNHETTLQRLMDSGNTSTDIASALLHLWLEESSRESEEIMEDRPRQQRPERSERPQRDYSDTRRPFDNRGHDNRSNDHRDNRGAGDQGQDQAQQGEGQGQEREQRPRVPYTGPPRAFTRMFLNLGAMDQVTPREISGAIYRTVNLPPGTLGKIEIFERCSYVGVPPEFVDQVVEQISQTNYHGRQLRMDVADQQDFTQSRGSSFRGPPRGRSSGGPPPPRGAGGGGARGKRSYGREVGGEDWE